MIPSIVLASVACLIAVITDVRTRRIPNVITLPLIALALALPVPNGLTAVGHALLLIAALLAFAVVLHRTGWLGGGDIKLAVGIGALLGYPQCIDFLLFSGIAGGILALTMSIAGGRASLLGAQLRSAAFAAITGTGRIAPLEAAPVDERVPYAVALAAGLTATLLLSLLLPASRFPW